MFNSFVSGYIFWRIIGGESKTAAFFTGLLTGLFSMILALLLVYVFYLLFYLAIYLLLGGVSYSEGFGSAILLAIMLEFFKISWLVVPISIVIAFIVRHDCKISWFVVPLSIAVAFILLHAFDN
ncbi:MAG: hypothetical protein LBO72_00540 [Helicobacteraceae bacterium]|nr:hypothetical protein [Helicobacteraceae bacterium]